MGVAGRNRRRPPVLPGHELERGPRTTGGARSPSGRAAWGSGAASPRHARRPLRAAPPPRRHPPLPGRRRPGAAGRPVDRARGQLVQPGAVRRAPRCPGAWNRPRAPTGRLRARRHLSPHLPVRDHLEPRPGRRAGLARPPPAHPAAGPVRALRRRLFARAHRRGAAARRPRPPHPRVPPELLRRARALRRRDDVGSCTSRAGCAAPAARVRRWWRSASARRCCWAAAIRAGAPAPR